MARVVHWMQNQSVAFYPTSGLRQLYQMPLAEYIITHFQILSAGDRLANLVQLYCMVGSIVGVVLVSAMLGTNRQGQFLTAVFCATIPMGILQASNTQNDYVCAFFLVLFVYFAPKTFPFGKKEILPRSILFMGVALGLALLTKGTAYLYATPFFYSVIMFRDRSKLG